MATKRNSNGGRTAAATRIETEKRKCSVPLTAAERVLRGDEMADCEVKIEELKADRSELARQVKTHERRRNELGHALEAGTEDRELVCEWRPDFKQNAFLLTRPDTREVIDTRPMTADDRTGELWPDAVPATPPRSPRPPARRGRPPGPRAVPAPAPAAAQGPDAA